MKQDNLMKVNKQIKEHNKCSAFILICLFPMRSVPPGPTKVGVILQALRTRKVHPCTFTSAEARLDKQVGIYILKFYSGELSR